MGITKSNMFNDEQNQLAQLFKAIGHPARIAIIEYLLLVNKCISKDIVEELPLAQTTIVQHLRELKKAGIIQGTIDGNSICYCLNPEKFNRLKSYFTSFIQSLNSAENCC